MKLTPEEKRREKWFLVVMAILSLTMILIGYITIRENGFSKNSILYQTKG